MPNNNQAEKTKIIVDGSNVAYLDSEKGKPTARSIKKVIQKLAELGFEPETIVDASTYYEVADKNEWDVLLERDTVHQVPAQTDADYFILKFAEDFKAKVVTNDLYEDYKKQFSWIEQRRVPVMVIDDQVEFHQLKK